MTAPRDIGLSGLSRQVSNSYSVSTSPQSTFRRPSSHIANQLKPFDTKNIKVLLLENVNTTGVDILKQQGYQVEALKISLPEDELIKKIQDVHVIGIRSKTKLTERVLSQAKNLIVSGCFCIGTNQVDLKHAAQRGVPVFNSPFSNSRSVAELTIGEIVCLARKLTDKSVQLHNHNWDKNSKSNWTVRGKTLGIVGYGHIGSQLSVLAEAMGLVVIYYDTLNIMAMGSATQVDSLDTLLGQADFVTLHVPETSETVNMFGKAEFDKMKNGSYLINNARGSLVDIPALIEAVRSGKIAGAALDVFPNEPGGNGPYFTNDLNPWTNDLLSLENVILTPHIGGSTEEAQSRIGEEVAQNIVRYVNEGSTVGAVNIPEVTLRSVTMEEPDTVRVIFFHKNVPGVLRSVNTLLANHNIEKQNSDSTREVAYVMADISNVEESEIQELYQNLEALPARIRTRVLYHKGHKM
ncbi:D-3-phosphoglycerate dehydrogenase [Polyplosphaeria fusca]|uniref:phosphoglycerate dehydrogenase n=1 Tax=Polyplosphaeria fusca TaxID=682080 RepID=A0A9P4QRN2_9PLEO|nr:D-3-phosphoglycerate dehydrogenase [Polyplosphaeria fusca]